MNDEIFYAFYSAEADELGYGIVEWLALDGTPVVCTCVSKDREAPEYKWKDKKFVGEVVKFKRVIRSNILEE